MGDLTRTDKDAATGAGAAVESRAREAWLSERLQELPAEEREVLREAAVIIDKLASG